MNRWHDFSARDRNRHGGGTKTAGGSPAQVYIAPGAKCFLRFRIEQRTSRFSRGFCRLAALVADATARPVVGWPASFPGDERSSIVPIGSIANAARSSAKQNFLMSALVR